MLHTFILSTYRLIAFLLVTFPVVLNVAYRGDIVTSLVYLPLAMIILVSWLAYIDKILEASLAQVQQKTLARKQEPQQKNTQYQCLLFKHASPH
jgi:hypothetical protein